jgi:hypothetical protein
MAMGHFWIKHNDLIRQLLQSAQTREVHTSNYTVKYAEIMNKVFPTLDDMAEDASKGSKVTL